jgi:hypothetical protein
MDSSTIIASLQSHGFQRIERDDIILDLLPDQTREKGIELWEKNQADQALILRFHLPCDSRKVTAYSLPISILEASLYSHSLLNLGNFQLSSLPPFLS